MHACDLVELASIISVHGPVLIHSGEPIPADSIEQYWVASKIRLDRWARRLKSFNDRAESDDRPSRTQWQFIRSALEEILSGEMLTRVWSAVLCGYDRRHGGCDAAPVARSVMIGHMEARHRALTLLVRGPTIDVEAAMKLNLLRRRTERWTDLLLGHLMDVYDVSEFAFDQERARDFAADFHYRSGLQNGRHVWPLALASLRAAFRQGFGSTESPNADINARIAASILACFPTHLFDSTGLLRSSWLTRLTNVAEDTQCMIDDLIARERPEKGRKTPEKRLRRFGEM